MSTCLVVFHDFLENKQGNIFKLQPCFAFKDPYTVISVIHMIIVVITDNAYSLIFYPPNRVSYITLHRQTIPLCICKLTDKYTYCIQFIILYIIF